MSAKRKLGGGAGQITASNVAAILGRDPFKGPVEVYHRLVNGYTVEKTEAMTRGHFFEPFVRLFCGRAPGLEFRADYRVATSDMVYGQETIDHPTDSRFAASPDGLVVQKDTGDVVGGWEGKTASKYAKAWTNGTPDHYVIQCQHLMYVTGADRWWVTCLEADGPMWALMRSMIVDIVREVCQSADMEVADVVECLESGRSVYELATLEQGNTILEYGARVIARFAACEAVTLHHDLILKDPIYEAVIVPELSEFFDNHIAPKCPPTLDSSPASYEIVASRGLTDEQVDGNGNTALESAVEMYREGLERGKAAAAMKKAAQVAAFEAMGGAKTARLSQGEARVTVSRIDKAAPLEFDLEKFQTDHPDVVVEFSRLDLTALRKARPSLVKKYESGEAQTRHDIKFTIKA